MTPDELRSALEETKTHYNERAENTPTEPHSTEQKQTKAHPNPQVLFSWEAPIRAYKKKPGGVFRFYFAIAILLTVIVVFMKEFVLILPIWATMFLVYALTITPPLVVENNITRFGIQTASNTFRWEDLSSFYFIKKFEYYILVVTKRTPHEHPLYLVIPDLAIKEHVLHVLSDHLIYQDTPAKTLSDRMAEWLTTLMPEEELQVVVEERAEQPHEHQPYVPTEEHPHQM